MTTFKQFVGEVYLNAIGKKGGKEGMTVIGVDLDSPASKQLGTLQGHQVWQQHRKQSPGAGRTHFVVLEPKNLVPTMSLSGDLKKGVLSDLGLASTPKNRVKAVDFYHYLITKHGLTLVSDDQSPGAKRVWEKLAKLKDVTVHGWLKGKPVNVIPGEEDEAEIWTSDSTEHSVAGLKLVATARK